MSDEPNQCEPGSASPFAGLASKIRAGKSAAQADYEATPPKLSITYRKSAASGGGIKRLFSALTAPVMSPPLNIELDGVIVGKVEPGQKFEVITTAGQHRLRILSTTCSATRDVELTNGQRLRFWCLTSISGVVCQRED